MSGALRVAYEGAWYHVLNRGAGRWVIFQFDDQRHVFLALLGNMTAPLALKSTFIVSFATVIICCCIRHTRSSVAPCAISIVTCDLGTLTNGTSTTVTLTVRPTATGTISNTAEVAGNESDPNEANNSDTEATTVNPVTCGGLAATIVGTPGNDVINGTNGPDVIHGLSGNDRIEGKGGNDVICGGPGHDDLYGNDGNDRLFGEEGNDFLSGGNGNDTLDGGPGTDRLRGDAGTDTCTNGEDVRGCP
jgi:RTX calcium-binding nonapeptide repeat (4 copies)/Domain of unknown function DUF11